MGNRTLSRTSYTEAMRSHAVPSSGSVTRRAVQLLHDTGRLNPLVDPSTGSSTGSIRRSLIRCDQRPDGLWVVTVGTPMPDETRADTTGSMGNNVQILTRVLPTSFELATKMLPGYDLQVATGIFNDVCDRNVLCRPQFEMEADKIVAQLTYMTPLHGGGDHAEDPQYGLFGAALLTDAFINRIGLKGYDTTITDAPGRDYLDERQLVRVFGEDVWERVEENGHRLSKKDMLDARFIAHKLLERAHAFALLVGADPEARQYWTSLYGAARVVVLPRTEFTPQVKASIMGLTEGELSLTDVRDFLVENGMRLDDARRVEESVANIPIGAQAALPNFDRKPKAGDLYLEKPHARDSNPWPMSQDEVQAYLAERGEESSGTGEDDAEPKTTWL